MGPMLMTPDLSLSVYKTRCE